MSKSRKKLVRKLIVVTGRKKYKEAKRISDTQDKIDAQLANPGIVTHTPTAAEVQTILDGIVANVQKRTMIQAEEKSLTGKILADLDKIDGIFVDKWAKQIQGVTDITVEQIKLLKFAAKGVYDGHSEPEYNVTNSHPIIGKIDLNSHLVHGLSIRNNKTGKIGVLDDAQGTEVYYFIGADKPKDPSKMSYLGRAKRGKYIVHFTEDQVGMTVWYYVVYLPRKADVVAEIGTMVSAIIV